MRDILCEIFGVPDEELDCVLESVKKQTSTMWFTPEVKDTLKAVLNLWDTDKMIETFDIRRGVAHTRRSRLGYDVLRALLERGAIVVKECCCGEC